MLLNRGPVQVQCHSVGTDRGEEGEGIANWVALPRAHTEPGAERKTGRVGVEHGGLVFAEKSKGMGLKETFSASRSSPVP